MRDILDYAADLLREEGHDVHHLTIVTNAEVQAEDDYWDSVSSTETDEDTADCSVFSLNHLPFYSDEYGVSDDQAMVLGKCYLNAALDDAGLDRSCAADYSITIRGIGDSRTIIIDSIRNNAREHDND
jgi:hypothetical protein